MMNSGNSTHKPRATSPERFRNVATGIGSTQSASMVTGGSRAMEVMEHMPEHCRRAVPAAEGYPTPLGPAEPVEPGSMEESY